MLEVLNWLDADEDLNDLLFQPTINRVVKDNGELEGNGGEISPIPDTLPILPLRGVVVYPHTAVPLNVGQPRSIRLVDDVMARERLVGLVTSKDPDLENPGPDDLYKIGTVANINRLVRAPDGTIRLLVQGISRFKLGEFVSEKPYLEAKIELLPEEEDEDELELEALARNVRNQFERITELISSIPQEIVNSVLQMEDPLQTAYTIANFQRMDMVDAQKLLEIKSVSEKLHTLTSILAREVEVLELGQKIQNEARTEIEKMQRDYFLREQLKAIQRELGEQDEQTAEIDDFREKITAAEMTEEAEKQSLRELDRLSKLSSASAEYGVIRTYLDWLVNLPWQKISEENFDIAHAREVLDDDHYGLEDVKERLLEFLAVRKLRNERQVYFKKKESSDQIRQVREGVILCFVGPPGVGKTSLGQSIARALGRKFVRISLGGVRDEAEIRGHRRTYIGALPGRILQALRRSESRNPIFMMDEIDKLGHDFRGDPASALLEVLDPEQNSEFRDHYMEVAFDLSQVMFITTANSLSTIPGPLRDRMEIIEISSYTEGDKIEIAKGYLVPRQLRENGLRKSEATFNKKAIQTIIRSYTREAGVRNLEREIGSVFRKVVTQIAEGKVKKVRITPDLVREYLGRPKYFNTDEISTRTSLPGVATGLSWTPFGGDVLFIEATGMPGGKGFQLTGSLGDVMQESARAALSYVRSHADKLNIDPEYFENKDIHLHVPAGAQPKDGPSAGVTIATTLVSLVSNRPIKPEVAMTGEITLRGQVMPVGGIKEKMLAAHRAGLKEVILPARNEADLEELPEEVLRDIKFHFVDTVDQVFELALTKAKSKKQTKNSSKPAVKKKSTSKKATGSQISASKKNVAKSKEKPVK
ncbi:MAG: endopeptidase La [Chloroflexi bacterium]|nr:endopeptidase La [Chloroflexota bacterium]MBT3668683.1 endopeptidase La [Chloroflexota bacterium]MBT4305384.1 endopeptidase La [Chloroflexota bacterium]MBT4532530.1 endopeptidase La [Chloroflexota bacterium]MBT4683191.1 endopeptidase La [Chloroflexota bacterium]